VLLGAVAPSAIAATVAGVDIDRLVASLQHNPVVLQGSPPALTRSQADAVRRQIARSDPGRIFVVALGGQTSAGVYDIATALQQAVHYSGALIVLTPAPGGSAYNLAADSWEAPDLAASRFADALGIVGTVRGVLNLGIRAMAKGDAAAGHPGRNGLSPAGGSPVAPGSVTSPGVASGPSVSTVTSPSRARATSPRTPASGGSASGSSDVGLIIGLVLFALLVGAVVAYYATRGFFSARASEKRARWQHEERADTFEQAQADFVKLGEEIEALDIDTSMTGADPGGKAEYAQALEAHDEAEQRLAKAKDDDYQLTKAIAVISSGREHLRRAAEIFDSAPKR
jgi:hypothetical protein